MARVHRLQKHKQFPAPGSPKPLFSRRFPPPRDRRIFPDTSNRRDEKFNPIQSNSWFRHLCVPVCGGGGLDLLLIPIQSPVRHHGIGERCELLVVAAGFRAAAAAPRRRRDPPVLAAQDLRERLHRGGRRRRAARLAAAGWRLRAKPRRWRRRGPLPLSRRPRHGPGWPRGAAGSAGGAPALPEAAWQLGGGICTYGGGGARDDVLLDAGQRPPPGDRPARAMAAGSAWRRWPGRRGLVDGRQQRPRRCSVAEGPLGPDLGLDLDQGGSDPGLVLGLTGPSAASGQRPPLAVEGCDPLRLAATAAHLLPGSVPG